MAQFNGDTRKEGLLGSGLGKALRNKRYIFWFWLLNLTLAEFGTSAFRKSAHAILDHSSYSQGLVQGFDLSVMIDLNTSKTSTGAPRVRGHANQPLRIPR